MNYMELEKIRLENKRKICIFGAGKIGKTWACDILVSAGFEISCYCDNNMQAGREVIHGINTIDFSLLCRDKERYLVFIAINDKLQDKIKEQLQVNGISNYVMMGFLFLQDFCESVIASNNAEVQKRYKIVVEDKEFLRRQFRNHVGYELNLDEPRTYNEKLQWLKLYNRDPRYTKLVDKYEVKKYIAEILGEEYVVPTIGVWNSIDEVEWDKLPNQFVIKCTHDCGSVIICKDKSRFDINSAKEQLSKALRRNFFWVSREWPYKNVRPRIIAEKYLSENGEAIKDYKISTFSGKVKLVLVVTGRFGECTTTDFFDCNFKRLEFTKRMPNSECPSEKPKEFDKMKQIAEKLSQGIPHIRVDFYLVDRKVYVGELTLYPNAGVVAFRPQEWDYKLGDYLDLARIDKIEGR